MIVLAVAKAFLQTHSRILAVFELVNDDVVVKMWDADEEIAYWYSKNRQKLITVTLSPEDQQRLETLFIERKK